MSETTDESQTVALERLRKCYPWPDSQPNLQLKEHGWFAGRGRVLSRWKNNPDIKLIVELGSWLGQSSKWFCNNFPQANLICVDHWEGSAEHRRDPKLATMLPDLHSQFLRNMWEFKDKVTPVRAGTLQGLQEIREAGLNPDLIYIDASHEEQSVYADVAEALKLFPDAIVVGDDWTFPEVNRALHRIVAEVNLPLIVLNVRKVWWLEKLSGDEAG